MLLLPTLHWLLQCSPDTSTAVLAVHSLTQNEFLFAPSCRYRHIPLLPSPQCSTALTCARSGAKLSAAYATGYNHHPSLPSPLLLYTQPNPQPLQPKEGQGFSPQFCSQTTCTAEMKFNLLFPKNTTQPQTALPYPLDHGLLLQGVGGFAGLPVGTKVRETGSCRHIIFSLLTNHLPMS